MHSERQKRTLQNLLVAAAAGEVDAAEWEQLTAMLQQSEEAHDHAVLLLDQMSSLEWIAEEPNANIEPARTSRSPARFPTRSKLLDSRVFRTLASGSLVAAVLIGAIAVWKNWDESRHPGKHDGSTESHTRMPKTRPTANPAVMPRLATH